MANEGQQPLKRSYLAGGDLSGSQFCFVKLSANATVVICSGATDKPIGVLQNTPASGGTAEVTVIGETKVYSSGSLSAGTLIGTDTSGHAVALVPGTDTTKYIVGTVDRGVSNSGSYLTALINCANVHRGA